MADSIFLAFRISDDDLFVLEVMVFYSFHERQ